MGSPRPRTGFNPMHANLRAFVIIAFLAAGILGVLGWQRSTARDLRAELVRQRTHAAEMARHAEATNRTHMQGNEEAIEQTRTDRLAVDQLITKLDALRQRAEAFDEARQRAQPTKEPHSIVGNVLAFTLWKNAGRATPEASLETALWASANGDIDTLSNLMVFDPEARHEAVTLFTELPANLRQEFVSPERLVAVLAAKDVPLGSAAILNQWPTPNETKLSVQIFDAEGKHRKALLTARSDDAGWRFVVPTNAVKRYADWLRAPADRAILSPVISSKSP
jgi:hypothetical protein